MVVGIVAAIVERVPECVAELEADATVAHQPQCETPLTDTYSVSFRYVCF